MDGLPENVDLSFIVGQSLLRLCVSQHQIIMHFDADDMVCAECTIEIVRSDSDIIDIKDYRLDAGALLGLIGVQITTAKRGDDGGLILSFGGDVVVVFRNDDLQYEAFQIHNQDTVFVA